MAALEKPLLSDGAPTAVRARPQLPQRSAARACPPAFRLPLIKPGRGAGPQDEQQEKKALCISIASMVLSIPALIVRPLLPQPISQPHNLSRAAHRVRDVGRPS